MKNVGPYGKVIVVEYSEENARRIKEMNLATHVIVADATKVMDVYKKVTAIAGERGCEVTINNVNVPSTEMTSILVTKGQGCVYFFSMATSFTKAALGARRSRKRYKFNRGERIRQRTRRTDIEYHSGV